VIVRGHLARVPEQRRAGGQPHHQLDPLGAGELGQLPRRVPGRPHRVFRHAGHEREVEFGVDESGPLAVGLVRQAPGADHHHPQILAVGIDRVPDGLAEPPAAPGGRQRVLHRVDVDGNDADRPLRGARPQQAHRVHDGVVDEHLLAGRQVELLAHDRLDHVPRQLRVAGERRDGGQPPALVGGPVLRRGANGEGRHLVEEEVQPVVVVDHHGDVRPGRLEPAVYRLEAVEERLPVGVLLQPAVDRPTDGGQMGGRDAAGDGSHGLGHVR